VREGKLEADSSGRRGRELLVIDARPATRATDDVLDQER
jgi:hypothetical protein